ncbi:MAG: lipopolysaccharide export system permease protein [Alteromonadaceae bacterium]|jgi:lipopolysaccharide export system permease protein
MRILDIYIGKVIASTTFITLAVFVSLSSVIKFVEQLNLVGRGNYDISHVALFVLYAVPRDVEIFFPMSTLIGGLIGIGMMASNSELIVMQSAGLSRLDIIKSVMKTAAIMILVSMAIGEWLAPQGEAASRQIRAQALSGGSFVSSKNGLWAKDGDYFVHIAEVQAKGTLKDIQIYRFNEQLKLDSWISAESALYNEDHWRLLNVIETTVNAESVISEKIDEKVWQSSLTPNKLSVITPESLSLSGLSEYLEYLADNDQDTSRYLLAFWRKIVQPFTVAVMLFVALSFIFGPLRSVSMGARIMMGVATGILFHLSNQVMGSMSLVYQLHPFMGAIMPSVLFVSMAFYFMNKRPS